MDNLQWQQRKNEVFARGLGNLLPVFVQRASNAEVWDIEGKRYIDFSAGIAVVNTGHSHPHIVEAVRTQVELFTHTCLMVAPYTNAVELAGRLLAVSPFPDGRAVFVSTGAEAVENAVKIARAYTGRPGIIAFGGSFHGRTNLCMGLTGKVVPYKKGFGPFTPEIFHVPFPTNYLGVSSEDSLHSLEQLFKSEIEPGRVAAVIIEPVQGEGGFYPAPEGFLGSLREICDRYGIVFVCDEIQTGFGRTGRLFACEHEAVVPDVITLAKGLAGGFPIAAVIGKREIMDGPEPGGLGGTYAGSPVGCAAGLAVLDVIEKEDLCNRALDVGQRIDESLRRLQSRFPDRIGDVRAKGAMVAMELIRNGDAGRPDADLTRALIAEAAKGGLLLLSCGVRGNVIRVLTPLTIPFDQLEEGLSILATAFEACVARGDDTGT